MRKVHYCRVRGRKFQICRWGIRDEGGKKSTRVADLTSLRARCQALKISLKGAGLWEELKTELVEIGEESSRRGKFNTRDLRMGGVSR